MIKHTFKYSLGDKVETRTGAIGFIQSASIDRDGLVKYYIETKYNETWQDERNITGVIQKSGHKTEIKIDDIEFNQQVQTSTGIVGQVTCASIVEYSNKAIVCVKGKDAFRWESLTDIVI